MTEDRPSTDGGEHAVPLDVQRAGSSPPDAPGEDGVERELPDLLGDAESVTTAHLVRAGLASGSSRAVGERLVDALEDKVTVVGSTLEAGLDPSNPEVDVLIETDHDPGAIASSLATVGPVDGVAVVDVTAAAERELEDESDDVDGADANDVFNELKEEVGQEGYGTVVDELEDVSFPGGPDPDEEVDLEDETGVELTDDGTLDLDDGDGESDLDGEDELTTKQLLGEEERDDATEVKAPDERAIEEAIEDVELGAGADGRADEGGEAADLADGTAGGTDGTADGRAGNAGDGPENAGDGATDRPAVESPAPPDDADEVASPSAGGPPADGPAGPGQGTPAEMDAFVAQFVEALESGTIDEERRTRLREALGIESTHSLDVRLEYLQKRVDNLAAYTDAWEAFLGEQGAGQEFVESVRDDIDAIETRLDDVEGSPAGNLEGVTEQLDDLDRRLSALSERHDDDVARLDTRMDSVESKLAQRVDAVEDGLGALKEKTSALLEWREHVDDVLGDG